MECSVSDAVEPREIFTCDPNTPVGEVLRRFQRDNFGSVVVVDPEGKPIGIFTERDYIRKIAGQGLDVNRIPIGQFMTPNPVCISLQDHLALVLIEMQLGGFRHVIVCDEDGNAVNMVSVKDLLDFLVQSLGEQKRAA